MTPNRNSKAPHAAPIWGAGALTQAACHSDHLRGHPAKALSGPGEAELSSQALQMSRPRAADHVTTVDCLRSVRTLGSEGEE